MNRLAIRFASLVVVLVAFVGCGSVGGEHERQSDDLDTVRDLVVAPVKPGEPRTGLSGRRGEEQHFSIDVPQGATNLRFVQSGGTGDADLYVRLGAAPTRKVYDYRPYLDGNEETVTPKPASAGTWYFMVRAYADYAGVSVVATFDPPSNPPPVDAGAPPPPPDAAAPPPPPDAMPPPPPPGPDCHVDASWPADWAEFENRVLVLVNQRRAAGASCGGVTKPSVPALTMEPHLREAARCHSLDMATLNYFSHDSKDGRSPWDRIAQAGYPGFGNAENIAAGQTTPDSVVDGWMNSTGHCNNIMTSGSNEIGVGYALVLSSDFDRYWTQDFGKR
jgi:uncharacterized protein YkwD